MTKKEFLYELQTALQGEMSQAAMNDNIKYYDNYIVEEVKKGKSEEEVISGLGNPRLIAKTLIDTTEQFGNFNNESYESDKFYQQNSENEKGFNANYSESNGWEFRFGKLKLNTWYGKLLMIVIAILLIVIVANVVAFLLPLLVPIILILLVYSLFFGGRRR